MTPNNIPHLPSSVGQRWTSAQRAYWTLANLPSIYLGVFVGLILGDAHLRLKKGSINTHLEFSQTIKHLDFFLFIFEFLSAFCQSSYSIIERKYKDKIMTEESSIVQENYRLSQLFIIYL